MRLPKNCTSFLSNLIFRLTVLPPEPDTKMADVVADDVAAAAVVEAVLVEDAVEDLRLFSKKAEAEAGS